MNDLASSLGLFNPNTSSISTMEKKRKLPATSLDSVEDRRVALNKSSKPFAESEDLKAALEVIQPRGVIQ
jgi:hypothetical protein